MKMRNKHFTPAEFLGENKKTRELFENGKTNYQEVVNTLLATAEKDDREHGTDTKGKLYEAISKYFLAGCDFGKYKRKLEETENPDTPKAVYYTTLWLEIDAYDKRLKDRERDEHLQTIVREAKKMKSVLLRIDADASKMEHDFRCLHEFIASIAKETDYNILDAYLLNITQYAERYNLGSRTDRDYLRMTRTEVQEVLKKERRK